MDESFNSIKLTFDLEWVCYVSSWYITCSFVLACPVKCCHTYAAPRTVGDGVTKSHRVGTVVLASLQSIHPHTVLSFLRYGPQAEVTKYLTIQHSHIRTAKYFDQNDKITDCILRTFRSGSTFAIVTVMV